MYALADQSVRAMKNAHAAPSVAAEHPTNTPAARGNAFAAGHHSRQMQTDIVADRALQRNLFLQFVRRRVDSNATAEDILQSAYTRATEKAGGLRSGESAVAWFYRVLRNAVIDHYRHRSAEDRAFDRWAQDLVANIQPNPQTEEFVCQCLHSIMPKLKPAYSEALREVDLEGNSLETFARSAGITAANAAVRFHRARKALRDRLIELCGTCCPKACENCTCS